MNMPESNTRIQECARVRMARRRTLSAFVAAWVISLTPGFGQDTLSLSQCYELLAQHYPLARQKQLLAEQADFNQEAIRKNYLPQVSLNAQATYQSDVPHVPLSTPGNDVPMPNKDQYRATVDVSQLLYDGGAVRNSIDMEEVSALVSQQQVDVSLHHLKGRVNQAYFSVLLLQEKSKLLSLSEENLAARLNEVRSAIRNGAALPASDDVIYAQVLQTRQELFEARADKAAALTALSELTGLNLDGGTILLQPDLQPDYSAAPSRPETGLYALQQQQVDAASRLTGNANAPRLSLFAQGGYGNPGLNLLDNTFQPFFMGGVRLTWKIFDWHLTRNQQQGLLISKKVIDTRQLAFDLDTSIELNRHRTEIEKLGHLIQTDEEIIALRQRVVRAARSQLQNGTLTASEYIREANALNESMITRKTHEISLLQARADYLISQGANTER